MKAKPKTDFNCVNCQADIVYATALKDNQGNAFCSKECKIEFVKEMNQELMSAGE